MKFNAKLLLTALAVLPLAGCVVEEYPASHAAGTTDVYYSNVSPSTGSNYQYRTQTTQVTATPAAPVGSYSGSYGRRTAFTQSQPVAASVAQTPAAPVTARRRPIVAPTPAPAAAPVPAVATVVSQGPAAPAAAKPATATTATTATPQAPTA